MKTNLFKVGKLDELHSHLSVLQLHSFAHTGLGMRRGQTDQGLQSTSSHRRGLGGEETGSGCTLATITQSFDAKSKFLLISNFLA